MKVAINGTGVGGPTLAYWLRRTGHEPVLFEKAPALRSGGYLIDFWGLGYEIAERMGLLPALRERCYEVERMHMVDAEGRDEATLDLAPMRELLHGRFISLARVDLSAALLSSCNGIPVHFGVSVAAIEPDDDGVTAVLSDGRRERFDLVVGADGLHSRVRELVFGPEARFERFLGCYVAAFRLRGYPRREELAYVSHTLPGRQVARVALRNDETLVLLVCRAELIGGDPPREGQVEALRRAFRGMRWEVPEILDRMRDVDDIYFDRVSQIHVPRWSSGRVGLLGDAAACPSLLAGEGAGLAMTQAYVLSGELHRAAGDFAKAFAAYEARLRSFVTTRQKGALWFRGFFAPRSHLGLRVRNLIVNALSSPLLARRVIARSLRDDLELPRYLAA
jgi:2-polyprenyl-6-methoxyphenol hydroxylase-like FAD-dependent oxidoreductase